MGNRSAENKSEYMYHTLVFKNLFVHVRMIQYITGTAWFNVSRYVNMLKNEYCQIVCHQVKIYLKTNIFVHVNTCCWRADHELNINAQSRRALIFVSARQHVLIGDNSRVKKKYLDSNIV